MARPASRRLRWVAAAALLALADGPAQARLPRPFQPDPLAAVNARMAGRVLDFTRNHGCDRRLYSPALGEKRDLYVYLPPGYDGTTQFPGVLWLHGISLDEQNFLDLVEVFDGQIRTGAMPPVVIAAPDGSIRGRPTLLNNGSFYVNSNAGRFEDYVIQDVWGFLRRHFAVRPERDAHVLAGASMGGFGAFNLAFKYRHEFGQIIGLMPPLNMRYADCHGRYLADYDPNCVMFREEIRRREVVGRFYRVIRVRSRNLLDPLVGRRFPQTTEFVAAENPIEMLATYDVRPGEFGMFIGYGTADEFNIDAQIEHFLDVAAARGIRPDVVVVPGGRHNTRTGLATVPALSLWVSERVGPYAPPGYRPTAGGHALPLCAVGASPVPPAAPTLP